VSPDGSAVYIVGTSIELNGQALDLFQHAKTGLVTEYGEIEETIAPDVLAQMTEWIVSKAGGR
jgi:hypothetical protein